MKLEPGMSQTLTKMLSLDPEAAIFYITVQVTLGKFAVDQMRSLNKSISGSSGGALCSSTVLPRTLQVLESIG
jgi:hypothetical protein